MSSSESMNKQTVVHPYNARLAMERNNPLLLETIWMELKGIILSERSQSQRLDVVWLHHKTSSKTLNCSDGEQISGWQDLGMRLQRGSTK